MNSKLITFIVVMLALGIVVFNNFISFVQLTVKDYNFTIGFFAVMVGLIVYLAINKNHFKIILK